MVKKPVADESADGTDSSVQNSARLAGADENTGAVSPSTSSEQRAPDKWAELIYPARSRGQLHAEFWKHAAAEALHRWKLAEMITGSPLQLSRADYDAAITAANSGSNPVPHKPALWSAQEPS